MQTRALVVTSPQGLAGFAVFVVAAGLLPLHTASAFPPDSAKEIPDQFQELLKESQSANTAEVLKRISFQATAAAKLAVNADDYASAARLANLAVDTAKRARNNHALTLADSVKRQIGPIAREFRKVENDRKTLLESPGDPTASYRYGRFVCLIRGDWQTGLPLLGAGDDESWRYAAKLEIAGAEDNGGRLNIANGWLQLSEEERPPAKRQLELHAYDWLRLAWSNSQGVERKQLDARLAELPMRYLNHMDEEEVVRGPWPLGKDGDCGNGKFFVNRLEFANGLGLHPPAQGSARVHYRLGGDYKTFNTAVAIIDDDSSVVRSAVTFWVLGDGKPLWKSAPFQSRGDVQYCSVSIKDVKRLEIRTHAAGSDFGAHAVWLDPFVSK